MTKLGQGHKSEVFAMPDGRILKLFFPEFAALAPVEHEVSDMLSRAQVEAPRVDEVLEVEGRPGIVFGNLRTGETLSQAVRLRPWQIIASARNLAQLHAAVHGHTSTELPSQRDRLQEEVGSAAGIPAEIRHAALEALARLPDADTVCHNDIHMLNVIVYPGGSMLIDWVLATRGNALADVAAAVLQLRYGEQPRGLVARAALETGRAAFWRAYLSHYRWLLPTSTEDLRRWEFPVAVALAGRREGRMRRQLVQRISDLMRMDQDKPKVISV